MLWGKTTYLGGKFDALFKTKLCFGCFSGGGNLGFFFGGGGGESPQKIAGINTGRSYVYVAEPISKHSALMMIIEHQVNLKRNSLKTD